MFSSCKGNSAEPGIADNLRQRVSYWFILSRLALAWLSGFYRSTHLSTPRVEDHV
jgi:hypothetical protein